MKNTITYLFLTFAPLFAIAQSGPYEGEIADNGRGTAARIRFIKSEHNFGQVLKGKKVSYTFKYKNIGDAPLKVTNVETTCGCTVTSWTRDAIEPGKYGEIQATFDTDGKHGLQNKVINIYSNAIDPVTRVKIIADVVEN